MQTRELCSGSVLQERAAGASSLVVSFLCTGWGTYPERVSGACFRSKLPRLHQQFLAKKYVAQQNFCSQVLLPHLKLQHTFSLEIVSADEAALLRERVARACCGSKLLRRVLRMYWLEYLPGSVFQEQAPSCVPAFKAVYYTVIKHDGHLRTRGKCRKHEPQASVLHFSSVLK